FSQVKVHTDDMAAKSAQSINALAYTSGNHIVFNQGQYSPGLESGKRLLGHELTHVLQQGLQSDKIQRACGSSAIGEPDQCSSPAQVSPESPRYLFNQNCDTFMGDNQIDLQIDSGNFNDGDTIEIHGLASEEGDTIFNLNLSCARAIRAKQVILDEARARNIHLNIVLYAHGEVAGEYPPVNRSIAIKRY